MRAAPCWIVALATVLGCTRLGGERGERERDVQIADQPLADDQQVRLLALAAGGGLLHWRLSGVDGPRCEAWRLVADEGAPERGRLVLHNPEPAAPLAPAPSDISGTAPSDMSPAPASLRLAYRLHDGHLSLTAPEHERAVAAPSGSRHDVGLALTCVFTGITVAGPAGAARRVILAARERFFLTADACADAGPGDDPPGPDELRTLGCASALADMATRTRLDRAPPASAPDPVTRLHRARAVHVLRRDAGGRARCDAWKHHLEAGRGHGRLVHRGADQRGAFTWTYAYDAGPGYITLQGPAEVRHVDLGGRRTEVVRASGCLLTRSVTAVTPTHLTIGPEQWYLSKSACESARQAATAAVANTAPMLVPACE